VNNQNAIKYFLLGLVGEPRVVSDFSEFLMRVDPVGDASLYGFSTFRIGE